MGLSPEELSTLRKHDVDKALGLKRTMVIEETPDISFNTKTSDWKEQLQRTEKGKIASNAFNILLIFQNDENIKGKFAFNLFTGRIEITGKVPWKRISNTIEIQDSDDSALRNYLSIQYGIKAKDVIHDALNEIALENQYHPIRDYLNSLKWDGIKRLDSLLMDFFDADV